VEVDPAHWETIVLNLVSNAFKFTFEGEIGVSLRKRGEQVDLRVWDTGTGIPPAELPRLFERFHRIEGARGRSFEGTGIGLALVHELVTAHGGTLSVSSTEGEGTTFVVTIPVGTDRGETTQCPRGHRREAHGRARTFWKPLSGRQPRVPRRWKSIQGRRSTMRLLPGRRHVNRTRSWWSTTTPIYEST